MTTKIKKQQHRSYETRGVTSPNPWTYCVCPKCGGGHRMRLFWTDDTTPKKFCDACKKVIDKIRNYDIVDHSHKKGG